MATSPNAHSAPNAPAAVARAAATLVVLRQAQEGIEVLLLRRAERGDQNSGAWVFPGGLVDPADRALHAQCIGLDDAQCSSALGVESGGLDYVVAALRESFEEAGLLFAQPESPHRANVSQGAVEQLAAGRAAINARTLDFSNWLRTHDLRLSADKLTYLSHWITPLGRAKRFDTRFFVAELPEQQVPTHDGSETIDHAWFAPAAALKQAGELKLMTPTLATLELLNRHASVQAFLEWARSPREIAPIMPRMAGGAQGPRPVAPDEAAFAEIAWLDPQGHGIAWYDLAPGRAVRLTPRLIRVTANNGSRMTGPGTNTYLVGGGQANSWVVVDPGPLDSEHGAHILAAAPGPITAILVTHTHIDHSPGCAWLRERTGAPVWGRVAAHSSGQDPSFAPQRLLQDGERIALDECHLRVVATPGHASNHLCYLLEEDRLLLTGDHLMQLSTVVINPPDGDMAAYMQSLERILGEDLDWLAPGHGFLMPRPRQVVQRVIEHRQRREAKVVASLAQIEPARVDALLPLVYDDVPIALHGVAARSLLAHLLKLRGENRASLSDGLWRTARAERDLAPTANGVS